MVPPVRGKIDKSGYSSADSRAGHSLPGSFFGRLRGSERGLAESASVGPVSLQGSEAEEGIADRGSWFRQRLVYSVSPYRAVATN